MTDNRTTDLLPCPFCGGEAETFNPFDKTAGTWCVICRECACASGFEHTEAEAIAAWNTRAATTIGKLQVEIEPVSRVTDAIARIAELGSGTCENVNGTCSSCGAIMYDAPNFCPNCGKRCVHHG